MNKILIALVLAVVMSGNAYAERFHLFCSNDYGDKGWGYAIDSNLSMGDLIYYNSATDKIDVKENANIEWSPKYIFFNQSTNTKFDGRFRINREDLRMYRSNRAGILPEFRDWGKCELLDGGANLYAKVRKFYLQKQKNNKF